MQTLLVEKAMAVTRGYRYRSVHVEMTNAPRVHARLERTYLLGICWFFEFWHLISTRLKRHMVTHLRPTYS